MSDTRRYNRLKQHEQLRVPNGWKEQDKALIIQLERIFDDIYSKLGPTADKIQRTVSNTQTVENAIADLEVSTDLGLSVVNGEVCITYEA